MVLGQKKLVPISILMLNLYAKNPSGLDEGRKKLHLGQKQTT